MLDNISPLRLMEEPESKMIIHTPKRQPLIEEIKQPITKEPNQSLRITKKEEKKES